MVDVCLPIPGLSVGRLVVIGDAVNWEIFHERLQTLVDNVSKTNGNQNFFVIW